MDIITLTKDNFKQEVYQEDLPVLVQFCSTACGVCRMMWSILEEIAREYKGKIKVGQVNIDTEDALTYLFDIKEVPTLIYFKECELITTLVGSITKDEILEIIK
jgi:thioredoxin 1